MALAAHSFYFPGVVVHKLSIAMSEEAAGG
jgi:hypothetical protein